MTARKGSVAILDPRQAFPGCATEPPFVVEVRSDDGRLLGGVVILLACGTTLPVSEVSALLRAQASALRRLAESLESDEELAMAPNAPGGAA